MAFYQDAPKHHTPKKNYGSEGSWDDEGEHYRGQRSDNRGEHGYVQRGRGPARPYGARTEGGSAPRGNRPYGDRDNRSFGQGNREGGRTYGDRDNRSFGQGNREGGRTYGDRDNRSFGQGNREGGRTYGDRDNRSFGQGNRGGNRPYGNRPTGDRPARPMGDRPARPMGDRRPPMPRPMTDRPVPRPVAPQDFRDYEYRNPAMPVEESVQPNENLLAGRNPIREALKSGRDIEKLLVQKGELSGSAREIVQMAREAHVPVQEVEKIRLDEIAPHHQGMLAFASAYQYSTVDAMLEEAKQKEQDPFLILLDGVTDPHNLGAIIRTAECVGAHGVIVPERRSVGLTPAAVKASAGAVEHMKVARVTNLNRTLEALKEQGVWAYAVTMDGEDYGTVNFKGGVALVIGAEGEGISRLTLENCDHRVSLPMEGAIDSLNASVAAGVMMYRVLASRKG